MVVFESPSAYIESCTAINEKIAAIDNIITKLLDAAAKAAESGHIDEYWFDDGHIRIRSKYRSVVDIERSIISFRKLRIMYASDKTGRMTRLMDGSNFTGRC